MRPASYDETRRDDVVEGGGEAEEERSEVAEVEADDTVLDEEEVHDAKEEVSLRRNKPEPSRLAPVRDAGGAGGALIVVRPRYLDEESSEIRAM